MSTPVSLLRDEVAQAFAADGPLARHDPQFRSRAAQIRMADEVAQALEARGVLVAEAGTGTGKTYAYLVPLLLSGRRALVSTATKSLQDQLFLRDLPRLAAQLGLGVQLALLKGRSSYLCLQRLELARQQAELPDRASVRLLARIEQWSQTTRKGDLAEIEGLDERSPLLPLVSSTRENCLGSDCPRYRDCHLMAARREALQADLVVVNHHLFFADLALRDTGMAELLPSVEAVVFDEAHQLNEAGVNFLGRHLGSGQLLDFSRDLLATGLAQARGLQDWATLAGAVEGAARRLRLACAGALRGAVRLRWEERARQPEFVAALESARLACVAAGDALAACADGSPEFAKLRERAAELGRTVAGFAAALPPGEVRWIDVSLHAARLAQAPLDIRETLRERVEDGSRAWIFTSATLGDDAELSWFTRSAGVEDAHTLRLDSPFDYARHGRLHVPSVFPRPNEPGHAEAVAALAARCAQALGGRTFVLTTTLRALREVGEGLRQRLATLAPPIEVLVQGEGPKRALLARFLATPRAVLVGSHSFWEGIDVPGRALQCVLIDKLPFPPPNDPLAEARCRSLEAQGQSPFDDYFVPEAAIALKQGAGRLIRSETDRGLLVICDSRLLRMNYGRRLLAALPPMPLLGEAEQAIAWLHELAHDGEPAAAADEGAQAGKGAAPLSV